MSEFYKTQGGAEVRFSEGYKALVEQYSALTRERFVINRKLADNYSYDVLREASTLARREYDALRELSAHPDFASVAEPVRLRLNTDLDGIQDRINKFRDAMRMFIDPGTDPSF